MKKILLVDDDTLVLELYRKLLAGSGFEVQTATDGLQAIKLLDNFTPELIILDLMMPRLSGADALRFIRSKPAFAKVPVIVLTNAFMSEQARAVQALGVASALTKGECTPRKMVELVRQVLGVQPAVANVVAPVVPDSGLAPDETHQAFLNNLSTSFTDLRNVSKQFAQDPAAASRDGNLAEFYRQTHRLTGAAGSARCHNVALLAGALEALLFELGEKPQFINPSTARTVVTSVDYLGRLLEDVRTLHRSESFSGEVLVVDDDPLANRIAVAALQRARLSARAIENPLVAFDLLAQTRFDLVLLDVEMPHLSGFELCRKLRLLPGYEHTPVIYVTAHGDFDSRSRSILSGGNDLIAKPIFPIELAVKAVAHLVRARTGHAPALLPI